MTGQKSKSARNVVDPKKTPKFWEKARRDKWKELFIELSQLLPDYDPAAAKPKIKVLIGCIELIKELQTQSLNVVQGNYDQVYKEKMDKLRERVKTLQQRVDQLSDLLRMAKISIPPLIAIPSAPKNTLAPSWIVRREKKWTNKVDIMKLTNKKKTATKKNKKSKLAKMDSSSQTKENTPINTSQVTTSINLEKLTHLTSSITEEPQKMKKTTKQTIKPKTVPSLSKVSCVITTTSPTITTQTKEIHKLILPQSSIMQSNTYILTNEGNLVPFYQPPSVVTPLIINRQPPLLVLQKPALQNQILNPNPILQKPLFVNNITPVTKPPIILSKPPPSKKLILRDSTRTTFVNNMPILALSKQSYSNKKIQNIVKNKSLKRKIVNEKNDKKRRKVQNVNDNVKRAPVSPTAQFLSNFPIVSSKNEEDDKKADSKSTQTKINTSKNVKRVTESKDVGSTNNIEAERDHVNAKHDRMEVENCKVIQTEAITSETQNQNPNNGVGPGPTSNVGTNPSKMDVGTQSINVTIRTNTLNKDNIPLKKNVEPQPLNVDNKTPISKLESQTTSEDSRTNHPNLNISHGTSPPKVVTQSSNINIKTQTQFSNVDIRTYPSSIGTGKNTQQMKTFIPDFGTTPHSIVSSTQPSKVDTRTHPPTMNCSTTPHRIISSPNTDPQPSKSDVGNTHNFEIRSSNNTNIKKPFSKIIPHQETQCLPNKDNESNTDPQQSCLHPPKQSAKSESKCTKQVAELIQNSTVPPKQANIEKSNNETTNSPLTSNLKGIRQIEPEISKGKTTNLQIPNSVAPKQQNQIPENPAKLQPCLTQETQNKRAVLSQVDAKKYFEIQPPTQTQLNEQPPWITQNTQANKDKIQWSVQDKNKQWETMLPKNQNNPNPSVDAAKGTKHVWLDNKKQNETNLTPFWNKNSETLWPGQNNTFNVQNWQPTSKDDSKVQKQTDFSWHVPQYETSSATTYHNFINSQNTESQKCDYTFDSSKPYNQDNKTKSTTFNFEDKNCQKNQKSFEEGTRQRPPVNWMTGPDIRSTGLQNVPSFGVHHVNTKFSQDSATYDQQQINTNQKNLYYKNKEQNYNIFDYNYTNPLENNQFFDKNQFYQNKKLKTKKKDYLDENKKKEHIDSNVTNQECWTPIKTLDWNNKFNMDNNFVVPCTLPTLVGDLALGTDPNKITTEKCAENKEINKNSEPFTNLSRNIFDVTNKNFNENDTIVIKNIFDLPPATKSPMTRQKLQTTPQPPNTFFSVSQLVETPNNFEEFNYSTKPCRKQNRTNYKTDRKYYNKTNVSNYSAEMLMKSSNSTFPNETNETFYDHKKIDNFKDKIDYTQIPINQNVYSDFNYSSPVPNFNLGTNISSEYFNQHDSFPHQNNYLNDLVPEYPLPDCAQNPLLLPCSSLQTKKTKKSLKNDFTSTSTSSTCSPIFTNTSTSQFVSKKVLPISGSTLPTSVSTISNNQKNFLPSFSQNGGTPIFISVPSTLPSHHAQSAPFSVTSTLPSHHSQSVPFSVTSTLPSHHVQSVPFSVNSTLPSHHAQSIPFSVTSTLPSHNPQSIPLSVTSTLPSHNVQSVPFSVTSTLPSHRAQSVPFSVTSTLPSHHAQSVPFSVTSTLPSHNPQSAPFSVTSTLPSHNVQSVPFLSLPGNVPTLTQPVPSSTSSTLTNFNLSTIFPEINQKVNFHYP